MKVVRVMSHLSLCTKWPLVHLDDCLTIEIRFSEVLVLPTPLGNICQPLCPPRQHKLPEMEQTVAIVLDA